jgi:hypothetical protein
MLKPQVADSVSNKGEATRNFNGKNLKQLFTLYDLALRAHLSFRGDFHLSMFRSRQNTTCETYDLLSASTEEGKVDYTHKAIVECGIHGSYKELGQRKCTAVCSSDALVMLQHRNWRNTSAQRT